MSRPSYRQPEFVAMTRTEWHLVNWARWQRNPGMSLGYPSRDSVFRSTASRTTDAMAEEGDNRAAAAVEAILCGLPLVQQHAVSNRHLATVWRMRDEDAAYEAACTAVARGLERWAIE